MDKGIDVILTNLLINKARSGCQDAAEALYRLLYKPLTIYLSSKTCRKYIVEDVIQEIMVIIMDKNSKFQNNENSVGWIFTAAKNLLLNMTSKYKNEETIDGDACDIPNTDDNSGYGEAVALLKKLVEPDEYSMIMLKLIYGFTFEELAKMFETETSSIKTKYYRLMKMLRENEAFIKLFYN